MWLKRLIYSFYLIKEVLNIGGGGCKLGCVVDPFVLSVCPEIKLRIPSLAVCLYVNV